MSEANTPNIEELAYHLWERQGRPENRSTENWLEAEYRAHSLITVTEDENQADLRMRGLGPLTQSEMSSRSSEIKEPGQRVGGTFMIASCVAGAALVVVGILFSIIRKTG
jgi:hypothetical protein